MSKKKSFSRSTMRLRDFHGGAIPTDLDLPAGPGIAVDRGIRDRQSSKWMSHGNRGYGERTVSLRQGIRNGMHAFEEKASYFPNPDNIGKNYDEDERKPVDSYARRDSMEDCLYELKRSDLEKLEERYVSENRSKYACSSTYFDSHRSKVIRDEFPSYPAGPLAKIQQNSQGISHSLPLHQQDMIISHPLVFEESNGSYFSQQMSLGAHDSSFRYQNQSSPSSPRLARQDNRMVFEQARPAPTIGPSNVWVTRMEGESSRGTIFEPHSNSVSSSQRAETIASKIAESSAVEKVSSGRWNSRLSSIIHGQAQFLPGKHSQSQGQPTDSHCIMADIAEPAQMAFTSNDISDKLHSSSDVIKEMHIHSSKDEYEISGHVDGRRDPQLSEKANYLNVGCFGEQCEGSGQKLFTVNDSHSYGIAFLESVRGKYRAADQGSYIEEESYGYTEPIQLSSAGYLDSRPVNESNTLLEAGEMTRNNSDTVGSNHYDYIESSNYGENNVFHRGFRNFSPYSDSNPLHSSLNRGNFTVKDSKAALNIGCNCYPQHGDASLLTDLNRGIDHVPISDVNSGNESYSQHHNAIPICTDVGICDTEHRIDMDGRNCRHDYGGNGQAITDGSRQKTMGLGHSLYRYDRQHDHTDYDTGYSYSSERLKSADIMDASKGYTNQRGQNKECDQGPFADSTSLRKGAKVNYIPQTFMGSTCKDIPNESFNSRILHSPKLMADNNLEKFSVQGENQKRDTEVGRSSEVLTLDPSDEDEPGSKDTMQESITGSKLSKFWAKASPKGQQKLTLKPHAEPIDTLSNSGSARERQSLFGGARPREVVLKERGIPDSVIAGIEAVPAPKSGFPNHAENQTSGSRDEPRRQQTEMLNKARRDARQDAWCTDVANEVVGLDKEGRSHSSMCDSRCGGERRDFKRRDSSVQDSSQRSSETSSLSLGPSNRSPQSGRVVTSSGITERLGYGHGSSVVGLAQDFPRSVSLGPGDPPDRRSPGRGSGLNYRAPVSRGGSLREPLFSRLAESLFGP